MLEKIGRLIEETEGISIALSGSDPNYLREMAFEIPRIVEGYPPKPSDYLVIDPEGEDIGIDEIREISSFFSFSPEYGKKKYAIVLEADRMTQQAANSFLKTLEEPPSYGVIIVTTTRWYYLLPTIRSRLVRFFLNPPPPEGDLHPWVRKAAEHDWRVRRELSSWKRELEKIRALDISALLKFTTDDSKVLSMYLSAFEILERFVGSDLEEFSKAIEEISSKLSGRDFFKFNSLLSRVALWNLEDGGASIDTIRFFDSVARAKVANFNNKLTLYNIAIRYREIRRDRPWS